MEPGGAGGAGEGPSSSSAAGDRTSPPPPSPPPPPKAQPPPLQQQQQPLSRYESQKRRDWNTFLQYLKNHTPPLALPRCSGAHVIEFLKYLDQFGKTKVHSRGCTFFGQPDPPSSCACPLRQAWGSLDALIGRLRAAHEESGGNRQEYSNPFAARAVRIYLREVRQTQAEARGIPYEKKKRKRTTATSSQAQPSSSSPPATPTSSTTAPDKSSDPPGGGSSSVS